MDGRGPDARLDQDCMREEDKTQRAKPTCTGRLQMSQDREDKEITKEEEADTSDHPRRNDQHIATTRCEHQQAHEEQSTEKMERVDAEWRP